MYGKTKFPNRHMSTIPLQFSWHRKALSSLAVSSHSTAVLHFSSVHVLPIQDTRLLVDTNGRGGASKRANGGREEDDRTDNETTLLFIPANITGPYSMPAHSCRPHELDNFWSLLKSVDRVPRLVSTRQWKLRPISRRRCCYRCSDDDSSGVASIPRNVYF